MRVRLGILLGLQRAGAIAEPAVAPAKPGTFKLLVCQPYGTRINPALTCGGRYELGKDVACSKCTVGKAVAAARKVSSTKGRAVPPNLPRTWPDGAPLEFRETVAISSPAVAPAKGKGKAKRKKIKRSAF